VREVAPEQLLVVALFPVLSDFAGPLTHCAQHSALYFALMSSTPTSSRKRSRSANAPPMDATPLPATAPAAAARPTHQRQATPFDARKSLPKSSRLQQRSAAPAVVEEGEEDEEEERSADERDEDEEMSDAEEQGDSATTSLAAQFDAAAEESGSERDSADDAMETDDSKPAKLAAGATTAASTTPSTPRLPQIVAASDTELQYHLAQIHRSMKKLRGFAVTKHVRKVKEATESQSHLYNAQQDETEYMQRRCSLSASILCCGVQRALLLPLWLHLIKTSSC
jgi:hypothetical protein